jgi:hypothetical protein
MALAQTGEPLLVIVAPDTSPAAFLHDVTAIAAGRMAGCTRRRSSGAPDTCCVIDQAAHGDWTAIKLPSVDDHETGAGPESWFGAVWV